MSFRRQGFKALVPEPGEGRLPNFGRGAAVARAAQLHDGRHRHLFAVQADFDASHAPFAFANRENRALARAELVVILVEAVVECGAFLDEILDGSQGDETEAAYHAVGQPRPFDARAQVLAEAQALTPSPHLLARTFETHLGAPGPPQQPVPRQTRALTVPSPCRHQLEQVFRPAPKLGLPRQPERIFAAGQQLRVTDALEPMGGCLRGARNEASDAQAVILSSRERG